MTKYQLSIIREAYNNAFDSFMSGELNRAAWLKIEEALTITGNIVRRTLGEE